MRRHMVSVGRLREDKVIGKFETGPPIPHPREKNARCPVLQAELLTAQDIQAK